MADVPDEPGGNGKVITARDPGPVAALVGCRALRLEREHQDMREPGSQLVHGALRTARVGEGDGQEVALVLGVGRRAEQVRQAPAEEAQPPARRRGHLLDMRDPLVVQLSQPAALAVRGLGQRVRQR